jgi:hypothetical protein
MTSTPSFIASAAMTASAILPFWLASRIELMFPYEAAENGLLEPQTGIATVSVQRRG